MLFVSLRDIFCCYANEGLAVLLMYVNTVQKHLQFLKLLKYKIII